MKQGYLKISGIKTMPDKYGKHIVISRIGAYDENMKWIKWITLNDTVIQKLLKSEIGTSNIEQFL